MSDEYKQLIDPVLNPSKVKGYGSAPVSSSNAKFSEPLKYLSHKVLKGDTLAGVALKYGITTEALKRANRLWTADSLHLRDSLKIPVHATNGTLNTYAHADPDELDISFTSHCNSGASSGRTNGNGASGGDNLKQSSSLDAISKENMSANDFFSQFDSGMSALKSRVTNQLQSKEWINDESGEEYLTSNSNGGMHGKREKKERPASLPNGESHGKAESSTAMMKRTPEPVIRSRLQRKMDTLEDDMFQL